MAINFPDSPTTGQIFTVGTKQFEWDGVKWVPVVTSGIPSVAPTLTFVSKTFEEIIFTITNNDENTAVIVWETEDNTPDENSIELEAGATSSNITLSGLNIEQTYTIYAFATVENKVQSEVAVLAETTYGQTPAPTISNVNPDETFVTFDLTNNDNDFEVTAYYEVNDSTPDITVTIPAGQTVERTISGLSSGTSYTLYARAKAAPKLISNTVSSGFTTYIYPYIQATGGTVTTHTEGGNNYKIHTFTSSGTFTITSAGASPYNQLDYLVVAGGGGGGREHGAGGGAGGLRTSYGTASGGGSSAEPKLLATNGNYTITIGAGGIGTNAENETGGNGNNSVFGSITSIGGGGGAGFTWSASTGRSGGSGGGHADRYGGDGGAGTSGQGFRGGNSVVRGGNAATSGGGGGGASEAGRDWDRSSQSNWGGDGLYVSISGSSVAYSGGGGAGTYAFTPGTGGIGGGGNGGGSRQTGGNGGVNVGGGAGGGGGYSAAGGSGGSGIVIIRYEVE